jgi:dihydropteroate synthase
MKVDLSIHVGGKLVNLTKPVVMGILNLTPDSFYDGGVNNQTTQALSKTEQMLTEGATIIDIGAQSTRPGAIQLNEKEEIERLGNTLSAIVKQFPEAIFSIDTYRSKVAEFALQQGVHIVNDISGGDFDAQMFNCIAKWNVPYIIGHIQGNIETMQHNPSYHNVLTEVLHTLAVKHKNLNEMGVKDILIDPGFGFGKSLEHNYSLLKNLQAFQSLYSPVVVGISRKSLINKVLQINTNNALNGTTALHMIALQNGASILRVHDVKEALEVCKLWKVYKEVN